MRGILLELDPVCEMHIPREIAVLVTSASAQCAHFGGSGQTSEFQSSICARSSRAKAVSRLIPAHRTETFLVQPIRSVPESTRPVSYPDIPPDQRVRALVVPGSGCCILGPEPASLAAGRETRAGRIVEHDPSGGEVPRQRAK